MQTTQTVTITERNQQLYELRKQLDASQMRVQYLRTAIRHVNENYDREHGPDLFTQMFS
jgi:uncharacterized coiled-coil protein SlyX